MDTERMRRVMERAAPAPFPPPRPGQDTPPPPLEALDALLEGETELLALCRELGGKSPALRRELIGVERAARRRRETLERQWFLDHGDRPPQGVPWEERRRTVSRLIREAWQTCASLERRYETLSRNAPDREQRRIFAALGRSAGDSRRHFRALLGRWLG